MILWGVTTGHGGMHNQVQGVLEELGLPFVMKHAQRRKPWCWLPVCCYRGALKQLTPGSDTLAAPWPDAVIASGRRSAALALAIKRASGNRTKIIYITDPRACRNRFDLIVAMEHDHVSGPNVISTRLALHRLTQASLAEAGAAWASKFTHLPAPRVAVLIGGTTHKYTLTEPAMRQLIAMLKGLLRREQVSLLITPSRRTGEKNLALLKEAMAEEKRAYVYGMAGENPYPAVLALADYVLVTEDSVNMMSEAAYVKKPLYLLPLPGHENTKPARFAERLIADGIARRLSEAPLEHWDYPMPEERSRVAAAIRALL